jgi:SEC-C motif-containing protein
MRSRYSAFALGDVPYLLRSWDPSTKPRKVRLDDGVTWRRLQITDTVAGGPGDADGIVEFRASFSGPDGPGLVYERSRFVRAGAGWSYVDGQQLS